MKTITHRRILPDELQVLKTVLNRAPLETISPSILVKLDSLDVVGICECGCRSVYFCPIDGKDRRVADGIGHTANGRHIGIMVWATGDEIAALDIVDYESSGELPQPE